MIDLSDRTVLVTGAAGRLRGLTRSAGLELGPDGIRVNSIHPGPIDTPMLRSSPVFAGGAEPDFSKLVPLGRAGSPDEVARLSAFLISDASSYVTGAEIAVDAGMTAGTAFRR